MESIRDELEEIIDGAFVSSYSLAAMEIFRSIIASIIISLIGPSGYGVIATLEKTVGSIRTIFSGVFVGLYRTIPREEEKDKNTIVVVSFLLILLLLVVAIVSVINFKEIILENIFGSEASTNLIYVAIGYLAMYLIMLYTNEVLKAYKKIPHANAVLRWLSPISQVVALFTLSFFITMSVFTVISAISIAFAITSIVGVAIVLLYTTFNPLNLDWSSDAIKNYLVYVVAATGGSIFAGLQFSTPNLLLIIIPAEQAGVFGVSMILSTIVRIPLNSINQIFPQVATRLYNEDKIEKVNDLFKTTSKIAVFLTLYPALIISVYYREIAVLFSPAYEQYSIIIPIMIVGQIFAVMIGTVGLLIMMTDNERGNIPLQFVLMLVTITLSVYLTVNYGVFGLAVAYSFGFTLNNFVELGYLYYSEKLMSLTRDHWYMLISYILFFITCLLIKEYIILEFNIIINALFSILFMYINYKFILGDIERSVLQGKFYEILNRIDIR